MRSRSYTRSSGSIDASGFNTLMAQGPYTGNVGGFVNWLLDAATEPKILVIDQATAGGRVIQLAEGDLAAMNTFLAGVAPELVAVPGDIGAGAVTPDPFE